MKTTLLLIDSAEEADLIRSKRNLQFCGCRTVVYQDDSCVLCGKLVRERFSARPAAAYRHNSHIERLMGERAA